MEEYMLTTIDNPYNPHVEWEKWSEFDRSKGYYTSEYLARVASTSIDLSDADNNQIINDAIDEILANDVLGLYIRVRKNDKILPVKLKTGEGGV